MCSLFNLLWSIYKKLGSLILKVEFLGGGFLLYLPTLKKSICLAELKITTVHVVRN